MCELMSKSMICMCSPKPLVGLHWNFSRMRNAWPTCAICQHGDFLWHFRAFVYGLTRCTCLHSPLSKSPWGKYVCSSKNKIKLLPSWQLRVTFCQGKFWTFLFLIRTRTQPHLTVTPSRSCEMHWTFDTHCYPTCTHCSTIAMLMDPL